MLPLHRTTSSAPRARTASPGTTTRLASVLGLSGFARSDFVDDDDFKGRRLRQRANALRARLRLARPAPTIAVVLVTMLLVYYVFLSPSSPSPSSNATQKPQPPALGSILTTTSMQPISSIASAVGQTAGASLDPSSAAVSTSSSTIDWSVLDDSRSLPVDTAKFSHNYPPFLSTFALSDEDRRSVWDSRADAVKRALSHAWDGYVQYAWGEDELS
ncbi:hypothetical protein HDU82_008872 [Entophlyctis luteolus]|nr:hypothetical protein HDU82_008872 [Entophlyctis luteolus]